MLAPGTGVPRVLHKMAGNEAEFTILFYPEATKNSSYNNCYRPRVKAA